MLSEMRVTRKVSSGTIISYKCDYQNCPNECRGSFKFL